MMKKRTDFTVRFAGNGIIVEPVVPVYTDRPDGETLVFNSMIEFEKWFEHHAEDDDAPGTAAFENAHRQLNKDLLRARTGHAYKQALERKTPGKLFDPMWLEDAVRRMTHKMATIHFDLASTKDLTEMCRVSADEDGNVKVEPIPAERFFRVTEDEVNTEFEEIDALCKEPEHEISRRALDAAHDVVHKFKGAK